MSVSSRGRAENSVAMDVVRCTALCKESPRTHIVKRCMTCQDVQIVCMEIIMTCHVNFHPVMPKQQDIVCGIKIARSIIVVHRLPDTTKQNTDTYSRHTTDTHKHICIQRCMYSWLRLSIGTEVLNASHLASEQTI